MCDRLVLGSSERDDRHCAFEFVVGRGGSPNTTSDPASSS
jgi:hypothetical protein